MTVIARVHPVYVMNIEQRYASVADPQTTKPTDLCCESAYKLLSSALAIAIYYHLGLRLKADSQ